MNTRTKGMASQHQIRKLCCILINAIPTTLTVNQADALIEKRLVLEKEIENMLMANSPPPNSPPAINNNETPEAKYWKSLIAEELDKLETAFPLALQLAKSRQSGKVTLEDLAEILNCSHPTIGKIFRKKDNWRAIPGLDRLRLIEELPQEFPQRWISLRSENSPFNKHFRR